MTPDSPPPPGDSQPLTAGQILKILERGTFAEETGLLRWSSNYTFLVTICLDDTELSAIYKPRRGERPLWDFPDGTLCLRERAAWLTSEALGWSLVPPTVLREGPRGIGSLQFFVEHDPEQHYFTLDETFAPQLIRLSLFDVVANNADRKGGHCLLDATGRVWGIDHGLTFHAEHKLRTVIWDFAGQPILAPLLDDLSALEASIATASSYRQELATLLSADEIAALATRIRRLLKTGTFPRPGPGQNYPWPPV
ncbi:MAG: SCO1664 family protein [Anaerolineae bacterium]|nr:SCO1664 family protein [Anaerolineae bacterium]